MQTPITKTGVIKVSNMTIRSVKRIDSTELARLPTPRLSGYLSKLQQCEESPELSDWSSKDVSVSAEIVFKSSTEWQDQYRRMKQILKFRAHVEK